MADISMTSGDALNLVERTGYQDGTLLAGLWGLASGGTAWGAQPDLTGLNKLTTRAEVLEGPETSITPLTPPVGTLYAEWYEGAYEQYFNQPIFNPNPINAGAITADQDHTLTLFLAYNNVSTITIASISNTDSTVTFTGPGAGTYAAGETLTYTVSIEGDADAVTVADQITWAFTGYPDGVVYVNGSRALPFAYPAQQGATEAFEFKTANTKAYSSETRTQLRGAAQGRYQFTFALSHDEQRNLELLMAKNAARLWKIPLWHEARESSGTPGDTILTVDTTNTTLALTDEAAIYDGQNLEILGIASLTANSITLNQAITLTGQLWIMPTRTGILDQGLSNQIKGGRIGEATASFKLKNNPATSEAAPVSLGGVEVLTRDSLTEISHKNRQQFDTYDAGIAFPNFYNKYEHQENTQEISWRLDNAADRYFARALIDRLAGKHTAVYVPTFRPDFTLTSDATAGTYTLTGTLAQQDDAIAAIQIRDLATDGLEYYTVTDQTDGVITVAEPLTASYTTGSIEVSYMRKFRSDSDTLTLTHYSGYSELTLTMTEVHNE